MSSSTEDPTVDDRNSTSNFDIGDEDVQWDEVEDVGEDANEDDESNTDNDMAWRSVLYPQDWHPDWTDDVGRFLHDFSYAGYHNGADPPEEVSGLVVEVTEFGADSSGESDSGEAIQAAIDAVEAAGGGVVFFPAGLYRVDDALVISQSGLVLRGESLEESRVFFTRHSGMSYDAHISFRASPEVVIEVGLASDIPAREVWLPVEDATAFAPGDDVEMGWVITDEFIADHEMTDVWQAFNGQWQTFFRRQVVEVDLASVPNRVRIDVPTRYPASIGDHAALRRTTGYLTGVGIESLGLANAVAWEAAWEENQVHLLEFSGVKDGWIRDIGSFRPPGLPNEGPGSEGHLQSSGVLIRASKRITIADTVLENAQNRGPGGNGYLFEIRSSNEVLIRDSVGRNGRHNFTQNWGFGTTGCVWLRVTSEGGRAYPSRDASFVPVASSDFHHSLAMANLIDSSILNDGWNALNRQRYSTGAGHSATENVFWNTRGKGGLRSFQFGWGYIIGTGTDIQIQTDIRDDLGGSAELGNFAVWEHTAPEDWTEGIGRGEFLDPQSLYESQRQRRLAIAE